MRKFDKDFRKWLKQTNLFDIWERIPHEFRQDIYFTFFRENEIYLEMNEGYWLEDECWVNIYYDKQTEDIEFGGTYYGCRNSAIEKAKEIYEESK